MRGYVNANTLRTSSSLQRSWGLKVVSIRIVLLDSWRIVRIVGGLNLGRNRDWERIVGVEPAEGRPINHDAASNLQANLLVSAAHCDSKIAWITYVVFDHFPETFHGCDTFIFLVMNANQARPFLSPPKNACPKTCLVRMELQGIRVQRCNGNGASEGRDVDHSLYSPKSNCVAHRSVDKIHALEYELIHRLSIDRRLLEVRQLE